MYAYNIIEHFGTFQNILETRYPKLSIFKGQDSQELLPFFSHSCVCVCVCVDKGHSLPVCLSACLLACHSSSMYASIYVHL